LFEPSARDWPRIGERIRAMRESPTECAGAKAIMQNLYDQGRKAGGIRFWTAFQREIFFSSRSVLGHEPLHMYYHEHPEVFNFDYEAEHAHIYAMQRTCGGG
jgi:hypothetical protein